MSLSAGGRYQTRKMAWWKILLIVLAVLAAALGILAWRFRDEIRAFVISRQYSPAELETQLADNDQTIRDAVDASSDVTVRPPTDEDRQKVTAFCGRKSEYASRKTDVPQQIRRPNPHDVRTL